MKRFVRESAHLAFTLHIYFSMAGFVLVLLFAVTGLTLNHDDFGWSEPTTTTTTLTLPPSLLDRPTQDAIGQYLRGALGLQSPAMKYRADETRDRRDVHGAWEPDPGHDSSCRWRRPRRERIPRVGRQA